MTTLSIIVPTYNRSAFLPGLIFSILDQQEASVEIILVDDGSTDETEHVMRTIHNSQVQFYKIMNSERGAARNYGLRQAKGKYITYFDSDDLYLPVLGKLIDHLQTQKPDVIYGDILHQEEKGNRILSLNRPYEDFTKNLIHNNFLACGAVIIKREIAEQFQFHEDRRLSSAEDWELWLRIHTCFKFSHFPEFLFKQIHHLQRSISTIVADRIELRDKYFAQLVSDNSQLKKYYGERQINLFISDRYTFIALAWSNINISKSFFYLWQALSSSLLVIKRKRFWAVLKKIILF